MYTQSRKFILILAVLLYGCETWSLALREERRLRAFENRVLRRLQAAINAKGMHTKC